MYQLVFLSTATFNDNHWAKIYSVLVTWSTWYQLTGAKSIHVAFEWGHKGVQKRSLKPQNFLSSEAKVILTLAANYMSTVQFGLSEPTLASVMHYQNCGS